MNETHKLQTAYCRKPHS